jgi:hypothetical protein
MQNLSIASIKANIQHYQSLQRQYEKLLAEARWNEDKFQELLKDKLSDQTK